MACQGNFPDVPFFHAFILHVKRYCLILYPDKQRKLHEVS